MKTKIPDPVTGDTGEIEWNPYSMLMSPVDEIEVKEIVKKM